MELKYPPPQHYSPQKKNPPPSSEKYPIVKRPPVGTRTKKIQLWECLARRASHLVLWQVVESREGVKGFQSPKNPRQELKTGERRPHFCRDSWYLHQSLRVLQAPEGQGTTLMEEVGVRLCPGMHWAHIRNIWEAYLQNYGNSWTRYGRKKDETARTCNYKDHTNSEMPCCFLCTYQTGSSSAHYTTTRTFPPAKTCPENPSVSIYGPIF